MNIADQAQTETLRLSLLLDALESMAEDVRTLATTTTDVTIQSYIIQAEIKLQAAIQTINQVMKSL